MPGGMRPPKEDLIKLLPLETERKVLRVTIGLTLLATLILVIALATDYWLILTVIGKPHTMANGNLLVGSHSGLWRACLDIEENETKAAITNCTNLFGLMEDADKAKKQADMVEGGPRWRRELAKTSIVFAIIGLIFDGLLHFFAFYSLREGRYTWKRLAAILAFITAICVLVCIQLVTNSAETKEEYVERVQGLEDEMIQASFGFSWVIAWVVMIIFLLSAVVFLLLSKKRKQPQSEYTGGGDTSADAPLRLS